MNSNDNLKDMKEDFVPEIDADDSNSIDDFIKQLEAKERDLDISSEMVIEFDDPSFDDTNPGGFVKSEFPPEPRPINENNNFHHNIQSSEKVSEIDKEKIGLKNQVSKLEADCTQLTEVLRRRQTDFDNFKNRVERERGETFLNQLSNLSTQMLPVLDNLNRALEFAERHNESSSEDFHQFFQGIVLVNQQLNEVLAEMGVLPVPAVGESFDPYFHEAVATEETDAFPPNTVTSEFLRGYCIGNKLIRAAMVKVAVAPKSDVERILAEDNLNLLDEIIETE
ncbi:hypothetical protein BH10ACI1_BH10ACI1_35100 [soil metagenome]